MRLRALYLLAISLFVRLELSRGTLVNRTIDDQFGDPVTGVLPTYEGYNWEQGATCSWHDATWVPGDSGGDIMTVNFTGSAVYVFIILANNLDPTTTLTRLSFSLDGEVVGSFVHSPTTSTDYEYNVTAYANDNLANAQHTLIMQTTGDTPTLILFDYVIYSTDDEVPVTTLSTTSSPSPPPSPTPTPTPTPTPAPITSLSSSPIDSTSTTTVSVTPTESDGASENGKITKTIVGVLLGGPVVVALAIGLLLCWYRRRRNNISLPQILSNDVVNGGRSPNGQPESWYWKEPTTGTWLTLPVPI
ncbi:hypothetical protein M0805_009064, partial [Coniferiporia weirii]